MILIGRGLNFKQERKRKRKSGKAGRRAGSEKSKAKAKDGRRRAKAESKSSEAEAANDTETKKGRKDARQNMCSCQGAKTESVSEAGRSSEPWTVKERKFHPNK